MKKLFFVIALLSAISAWAAESKVENYRGALLGEAREVEGVGKEYVKSVCLEGNMLYCGAGHSVYALDATDALSPHLLSSYEIYGYVRQIVVQGHYLYAACRESGVWILDVSDPRNLKLVSRYDPVELATGIDVAGEVMFLACRQNGVEMVDVSDPSHPTHIRLEKTSESQSIFYCDGILYSGEWADSWVTAIDASDMSAVKTLGTSPLQGFGDGVWTSGKYLYASTGHHSASGKASKAGDGHGLEIFDISDKAKPRHLARVDFAKMYSSYPDYWTVRPANNGNYLVCADSFNGLYVVDAHRPAQPFIASRLTATDSKGKALPVTSVAVGKGVIYATVHQQLGLLAIPCPKIKPVLRQRGKLPVNAAYRYPYETSEDSHFASWKPSGCFPVRGVAAKDSLVFAACTYGGLAILTSDDSGRLAQIGKGPMAYASDVAICGDRLVVAEGFGGVAAYKISRNAAGTGIRLEESARFDRFNFDGPHGLCFWVFAPDDGHIVAATRYHGYYYFTRDLKYLGQAGRGPGWDKYVPDAADSEGWYPRIQHNAGVFWVNVHDLAAGEKKDAGFKPTLFDGVCAYKDDRFITCTKGKMYVYSHAEAGEPRTGVGENLYGAPAWDGDARLGLTARIARRISMVDLSNDRDPKVLWTESCEGFPEMATFWKGRFLVPCGYQGLLMEKNPRIVRTFHCGEDAQGVAVDESGFYFISNRSVSKYTLQGELLATWKEDTPELIQHFDGGIVIDGLLYCSHSNYPEVPMASSIEVFDPENLTHLKTISLGIDSGSCTWVVRGDDCWYVGFAHYDSKTGIIKDELDKDNRWTQIVRYDNQWHRTAGWILPKDLLAELHPYSLSGALYLNGKFYCTGHNEQKLYMLEFPPHGMTMQWTGTMDIPFKGQGIAIDREGNLWGVDRENGTVMMAKMEIKLGE